MLIYIFGLPAAGKDYVGQVLADEFGFYYHNGDLDLTDELREAVRDGRPFTDDMRDRFYAVLVERIGLLLDDYPNVALGQATFKERHRRLIAEHYPQVRFMLVTADEEVRMARLQQGFNPVTVDYARRIAAFFEPPEHPCAVLANNGGRAEIVEQLRAILAEWGFGAPLPKKKATRRNKKEAG